MNISEINELLKVIDKTNLGYVKLETNDLKLEVSKNINSDNEELFNEVKPTSREFNNEELVHTEICETVILDEEEITLIESPLMGTFYSSPGPNKEVFVNIGDIINIGDTLCIVEAMKLMNEITSDVNGEIVEILVKNEELVEYNQPLFKIRPL